MLAKHVGFSLTEIMELPDFEREIYLNLVLDSLKREENSMNTK